MSFTKIINREKPTEADPNRLGDFDELSLVSYGEVNQKCLFSKGNLAIFLTLGAPIHELSSIFHEVLGNVGNFFYLVGHRCETWNSNPEPVFSY